MTRGRSADGIFPAAENVREFLEQSDPISLRQLCKAFRIPANRQKDFKDWLRKNDFRVIRGHVEFHARTAASHELPEVLVVEVDIPNEHGETVARPVDERQARQLPEILLPKDALATGSRALIRIEPSEGTPRGRVIRVLTKQAESVLCVIRHIGSHAIAVPTQRSRIPHYRLDDRDSAKLTTGVMVRVQPQTGGRQAEPMARLLEVLPAREGPERLGDIAIAEQGIPHIFSAAALEIAERGEVPKLGAREDLREIPLVTIDGEDARDFDDAVFAEPDGKGWHLLVAIADVAHYVPSGSTLDEEAQERGNSVYLADQVVPMLPEALSNGLCSLKPHEERACLAVHLWIDAQGNRREYRFCRGLMRSHARLTYTQVDAFLHGEDPGAVPHALHTQVKYLYGAFKSFMEARHKRGTLELDIPEYRVVFKDGYSGEVKDIVRRAHLDSHRLIEEFMIAANVAAGETIEKEKLAGLYRVHEPPSPEKLTELEHLLESAKLRLAKPVTPIGLNGLLAKAAGTDLAIWLSMAILRTQSQATYTPKNLGHFGLGLRCYTHFTSPIRRYADLVVHRALLSHIEKHKLEASQLSSVAEHIAMTERRAMVAERDTVDRYAAQFLKDRVGATFGAIISGVTGVGVFVTLDEVGASGLVPIRHLGSDYFHFEQKRQRLIGRRSGLEYGIGQKVNVVLLETQGITGKLTFGLENVAVSPSREGFRQHRGSGGGRHKDHKGKNETKRKKR